MLSSGINFMNTNVVLRDNKIISTKTFEDSISSFRCNSGIYCYGIVKKLLLKPEYYNKPTIVSGKNFYHHYCFKPEVPVSINEFGQDMFSIDYKSRNTLIRNCYYNSQAHFIVDILPKIHDNIRNSDSSTNTNSHLDLIDQTCIFNLYCQHVLTTIIENTYLDSFIDKQIYNNLFEQCYDKIKSLDLEVGVERRLFRFELSNEHYMEVSIIPTVLKDYYDDLVWNRNEKNNNNEPELIRKKIEKLINYNYNIEIIDNEIKDVRLKFRTIDANKIYIGGSVFENLHRSITILEPVYNKRGEFLGAFEREIYYCPNLFESVNNFVNSFEEKDFYESNKRNLRPNYISKESFYTFFKPNKLIDELF